MKYRIYSPNLKQWAAQAPGQMTSDPGQAFEFTVSHLAWLAALELGRLLGHAMQIHVILEAASPTDAAAKQVAALEALGVDAQAAAQVVQQVAGRGPLGVAEAGQAAAPGQLSLFAE